MDGDGFLVAKARELVAERERRLRYFPAAMFSENLWDMLLHLFICLFNDEVVSEERLIVLAHVSPEVGRRWLRYLVQAGYVEARDDGEDVVLSAEALSQMRAYLTAAREAARTP